MLPTETTYIYFYVLLGGFMTVWAFRKAMKSEKKISEFEYIGFSAFWGIALIVAWGLLTKISTPPSNLFENPFSTGFILSILGMCIAYLVAEIIRAVREARKFGFKNILNSLFKRK